MVTIIEVKNKSIDGTAVFELRGKSSDAKPIGFYNEALVGNGSTFLEMDTGNVFMFDEENQKWEEL